MGNTQTGLILRDGLVSFLIIVVMQILNLPLLFYIFSVIPLLLNGMNFGVNNCLLSALVAAILFVVVKLNLNLALFYVGFMVAPTLLAVAHLRRKSPYLHIVSEIALYYSVIIIAADLALMQQGGLQESLNKFFADSKELQNISPDVPAAFFDMIQNHSYVFIAAGAWWWMLGFFVSLWFALKKYQLDNRIISMSYATNPPPFALFVLILSGFISLLGLKIISYSATAIFMIILLPYAVSGAMYTPLRNWRGMRSGFAFVLAMIGMILFWPAVLLAGIGAWQHAVSFFAGGSKKF